MYPSTFQPRSPLSRVMVTLYIIYSEDTSLIYDVSPSLCRYDERVNDNDDERYFRKYKRGPPFQSEILGRSAIFTAAAAVVAVCT